MGAKVVKSIINVKAGIFRKPGEIAVNEDRKIFQEINQRMKNKLKFMAE